MPARADTGGQPIDDDAPDSPQAPFVWFRRPTSSTTAAVRR